MSFYKSSSIQKLKEENEKLKKDIEVLVATLEKDNEKLSKDIKLFPFNGSDNFFLIFSFDIVP